MLSRKPRVRRHFMWEVGMGCIQGTQFASNNNLKRSDNMKIINNVSNTVENDSLQRIET